MFFVGLDIHTKHISICALNETGQVAHRSRVRSIEEMMRILSGLPDRFEVCYEAGCGYGHFHDLLRPLAVRVLVAHLSHRVRRSACLRLQVGEDGSEFASPLGFR
jgi:hypothetical protein